MKHTELRAAVLDALEKHDTGATLFDGRPAVFDEADFPAIAVYLIGAEYTGEELDSDTWQAELHIEVFLPAQVRTLYRVLLQAQVHTHILSVLVLIRTPLRLVHMDIPSPLTLLVTRKTPSKTSHLTTL